MNCDLICSTSVDTHENEPKEHTQHSKETNNHQAKMKKAVAVKVVSDIPKFNST